MNTRPADYESAALPTELFQHGLFSFCFLPHGFDGSRRCSSPPCRPGQLTPPRPKAPGAFPGEQGRLKGGKFIRDRSYSTTKGRARSRPILARGGKERGKSRADRFWYGQSLVQEGSFPVSKQRCPSKKHRLPAGQPPSGHRGDVVRGGRGGFQSQSIKSAKMALLTRKPRGVRQ